MNLSPLGAITEKCHDVDLRTWKESVRLRVEKQQADIARKRELLRTIDKEGLWAVRSGLTNGAAPFSGG